MRPLRKYTVHKKNLLPGWDLLDIVAEGPVLRLERPIAAQVFFKYAIELSISVGIPQTHEIGRA